MVVVVVGTKIVMSDSETETDTEVRVVVVGTAVVVVYEETAVYVE